MNERILELAVKSGLAEDMGRGYKFPDNYLDFAELIVKECTKVIVHGGYWSGGPLGPKRQCTPPEIAQMIKEYFGVEE